MTPLIICMRWGSRYGAHYVNRLYASCRRHLASEFQFVCFTDNPDGLVPGVDTRPLPPFEAPDRILWQSWRKLSLWRSDLPSDLRARDALFLDLDVVVVGALDAFFGYRRGHFAVIENWTRKGHNVGNTSVFRYTVGGYSHIYEAFHRDQAEGTIKVSTEQEYISRHLTPGQQVFWPKPWVRSFKEELVPVWPVRFWKQPVLPADARIVAFHGKPDPDEAARGEWPAPLLKKTYKVVLPAAWITEHWR